MTDLTHLDENGRAKMVDVGVKPATFRRAVARGWVEMAPETLRRLQAGEMKKAMFCLWLRWPVLWAPSALPI